MPALLTSRSHPPRHAENVTVGCTASCEGEVIHVEEVEGLAHAAPRAVGCRTDQAAAQTGVGLPSLIRLASVARRASGLSRHCSCAVRRMETPPVLASCVVYQASQALAIGKSGISQTMLRAIGVPAATPIRCLSAWRVASGITAASSCARRHSGGISSTVTRCHGLAITPISSRWKQPTRLPDAAKEPVLAQGCPTLSHNGHVKEFVVATAAAGGCMPA